ncbi:MAG: hypothetical protein LBG15_15170 [Dysgonamonadaceae bacterium]|nr:hypothetical protein [Dysgonamonadaceae bacterium]
MKKYRLFTISLWLSGLAVIFNSCDDGVLKSDYDYQRDSLLTLSTIQFDKLEKISDEAIELEATITDAGQSEIYDQGFIYTTDESFAVYEAVSVAPDTLETGDYLLSIEEFKIPQGKNFYFKAFVLTKDGIAVSSEIKNINLPVTWEDVGTVEFEDLFWTGGEKANVTIQKFFGQNRYRLVDVYSEVFLAIDPEDPDIEKCRGKYLEFYLDEDGNADKLPSGLQDLGLGIYGYEFYWALPDEPYASYCTFTNNANQYTITGVATENGEVAYTFSFVFTWIEGYPGEIPESKLSDFNNLAYEEIQGALSEFTSTAYYNESWTQSFAKAVDIDAENDASQYKNLYYLADLYYEGYGLAFYYDGENITIPDGQQTGTSFKKPLYVSQSENIESSVLTTAKDVKIYTFGLKFHYEDGTVVGEFAEIFYYSEDPISYAIEDFYGSYKLTGPCVFDGYPDADMDVTITAGTTANTFIITGIDYIDEITATFDNQNSLLEIAPQDINDFVYQGQSYPTVLLTIDANWDDSEIAKMSFGFNMNGNLVMVSNSEAIGYVTFCELGYIDGYYNLKFTPQSEKALTRKSSVSRQLTGKTLNKGSVAKKQKCSKGNFAVQSKTSVKSILNRNRELIPVF